MVVIVNWERRAWSGTAAYSDTKLHDAMLAFAVARRWDDVCSNALKPGWVATKMGGPGASDDLSQAHLTQVWLAVGVGAEARVSGDYIFHCRPARAERRRPRYRPAGRACRSLCAHKRREAAGLTLGAAVLGGGNTVNARPPPS